MGRITGSVALLLLCLSCPTPRAEEQRARLYSVALPIPLEWLNAAHSDDLSQALMRIQQELPQVTLVHLMFDIDRVRPHDVTRVLDTAYARGYQAVIAFAQQSAEDKKFALYRPAISKQLDPKLNPFVSDPTIAAHPALYALMLIDEPWHHKKRPFYTTEDLKTLYRQVKGAGPESRRIKVMVQFSRELWKRLAKGRPKPQLYWDRGLCDLVQISALEFQDGQFLEDQLDQNHYWSRKIIHQKTPEIPLWTSVQTMGREYGPSKGYWFPRERGGHQDLTALLNAVTDSRYEAIHPLTGMMFQSWSSESPRYSAHQYRLGDEDPEGQPLSQAAAAADAREAIRRWWRMHP
jgi:hypothetical protein